MSLRSFHLVFIATAVVLAAFFAAWAAGEYRAAHEAGYAVTAVGSIASAALLAVYGAKFQRRTRQL